MFSVTSKYIFFLISEIDVKFGSPEIYCGKKGPIFDCSPYFHFRKERSSQWEKKSTSSEMEIQARYIDLIINIGQFFFALCIFFINSRHFS